MSDKIKKNMWKLFWPKLYFEPGCVYFCCKNCFFDMAFDAPPSLWTKCTFMVLIKQQISHRKMQLTAEYILLSRNIKWLVSFFFNIFSNQSSSTIGQQSDQSGCYTFFFASQHEEKRKCLIRISTLELYQCPIYYNYNFGFTFWRAFF